MSPSARTYKRWRFRRQLWSRALLAFHVQYSIPKKGLKGAGLMAGLTDHALTLP